jgi:hypothetical protein
MFRDPDRYALAVFHASFGTVHYAVAVLGVALTTYFVPGHDRAFRLNSAFGAWEVESDRPPQRQLRMTRQVCLGNERYRKVLRRLGPRLAVGG